MFNLKYFLVGLLCMVFTSCMQKENELFLFVGSYANTTDPGISLYRFDMDRGTATLVKEISGIQNPSYLTVSRDGKFVYSVSETDIPDAKICAYSFDKATGAFTLLNEQKTEGSAPCYIWIDSQRHICVTANYSGGSISLFPISADGMLLPANVYTYEGGTPGSERQAAPHLHCVYASLDEKYLYANDLGTDRIYKYELIVSDNGLSLQNGEPTYFSLVVGEGPRHTVFHPNGKFAYLIGELSGRVAVLNYNQGDFIPIQYVEADTLHAQGSADIHITSDGRFLYASNRLKGDGIAIFSIDLTDGMLTKVGYQMTGIHPRNFIITPNNKFLLCACRDSNFIQIFEIDQQTGLLKDTGKVITVSKPVCLKFSDIGK